MKVEVVEKGRDFDFHVVAENDNDKEVIRKISEKKPPCGMWGGGASVQVSTPGSSNEKNHPYLLSSRIVFTV